MDSVLIWTMKSNQTPEPEIANDDRRDVDGFNGISMDLDVKLLFIVVVISLKALLIFFLIRTKCFERSLYFKTRARTRGYNQRQRQRRLLESWDEEANDQAHQEEVNDRIRHASERANDRAFDPAPIPLALALPFVNPVAPGSPVPSLGPPAYGPEDLPPGYDDAVDMEPAFGRSSRIRGVSGTPLDGHDEIFVVSLEPFPPRKTDRAKIAEADVARMAMESSVETTGDRRKWMENPQNGSVFKGSTMENPLTRERSQEATEEEGREDMEGSWTMGETLPNYDDVVGYDSTVGVERDEPR